MHITSSVQGACRDVDSNYSADEDNEAEDSCELERYQPATAIQAISFPGDAVPSSFIDERERSGLQELLRQGDTGLNRPKSSLRWGWSRRRIGARGNATDPMRHRRENDNV